MTRPFPDLEQGNTAVYIDFPYSVLIQDSRTETRTCFQCTTHHLPDFRVHQVLPQAEHLRMLERLGCVEDELYTTILLPYPLYFVLRDRTAMSYSMFRAKLLFPMTHTISQHPRLVLTEYPASIALSTTHIGQLSPMMDYFTWTDNYGFILTPFFVCWNHITLGKILLKIAPPLDFFMDIPP